MHYHNFYSFACLVFFLLFRLPLSLRRCSVLTFARPLIFRGVEAALRPLWEFGLASPTLHYHRGRRSSARPPIHLYTRYTRDCSSPVGQRSDAATGHMCNGSVIQDRSTHAATPLRYKGTTTPTFYYI
nr:MAG TPA: hypothetical protein [Caudoviricetes sp.]